MRTTAILATICVLLVAACTLRPQEQAGNPAAAELPLAIGTRWTYSYRQYQPAADPSQIVTAEYQLIETVTETRAARGLFIARVKSELKPVQVPAEWGPPSLPAEFWYILKGWQVFSSNVAVDPATVDTATLNLAFDFPLAVNRSWCPVQVDLKDPAHAPITNCDYAGKLTVLAQSGTQTPAGSFDSCYHIQQFFNDGSFFQWFCRGVGVVSIQFDHNGTRFGFKQELTGYNQGGR